MVSPVPSSPAPRLMDPDMPMARTTSRAFIFRVTSASAVTVTDDSLPDANHWLILGLNNALGKVRETRPRVRTVLAVVLQPVVNDTPRRLIFSREVGGRQSSRPREPARTVSAGGRDVGARLGVQILAAAAAAFGIAKLTK